MYQMNRILFWDGAHRETVGAEVVIQRDHVALIEVQVTTVNLRVRATWPIVAVRTDVEQATSGRFTPIPSSFGEMVTQMN